MTSPTAQIQLPRLRRPRKFDVVGLIGKFHSGIAGIDAQNEPFANAWDASNEVALAQSGPLWVALGDSATQGVGASCWENGWVHNVLRRLQNHTGQPWRVVVLAMSGARLEDVTRRQIPVMQQLLPTPQLITCFAGSNDLVWRGGLSPIIDDATELMQALPERCLLSRLNGFGRRPEAINRVFSSVARKKQIDLFNIWKWPSGRNAIAADRVHPNDLGYRYMAERAWEAVRLHTQTNAPSKPTKVLETKQFLTQEV